MLIYDEIYGEFEVNEVIEELLMTDSVRHLLGDDPRTNFKKDDNNVNRYQHYIGVMLFVKMLGGSVEEQLAGLLHDLSHRAFIKIVDAVFNSESIEYYYEVYRIIIENSNIPTILEKYGYNYSYIIGDDSKWTLLQQPYPNLCAERVDFELRNMVESGYITIEKAREIVNNFIAIDGKMALKMSK